MRRTPASAGQISLDVPGLERLRGVIPFGLALSPDEAAPLRRVRRAERRGRGGHRPARGGGLYPRRVVRLVGRRVEGWAHAVRLEREGDSGPGRTAGADSSIPGAAFTPATSCRARCRSFAVPDAAALAVQTRAVLENTLARREVAVAPSHPLAARARRRRGTRPHPAHRVRRQGEPHVRPGLRPAAGRRRRPVADDARPGHDRQERGRDPGGRRRGRLAQPPCAGGPVRHQRQLLLRRRPVEHGPPLGGGRLPERVGRGERAVAHRGAAVQPGAGPPLRVGQQRRRVCPRTTTRPARSGSTSTATACRSSTSASAPRCPRRWRRKLHKETGIRMAVSFPLPKPLFDRTSRIFATYNMAIPDQYRMDMFEQELRERWLSGKEPFPSARHDGASQRPPHRRAPGRRLSLRGLVHGRQRPRAWPARRHAVAHALVEGHARHRDRGRSAGRAAITSRRTARCSC